MNLQSKFNVMLKSKYGVIVKDIFSLNTVNWSEKLVKKKYKFYVGISILK